MDTETGLEEEERPKVTRRNFGVGGHFSDRPEDQGWKALGACFGHDPNLWFPERGVSVRPAKRICATCPVTRRCLDYAIRNHETIGIWGGTTERERRRTRRGLPLSVTCIYCGRTVKAGGLKQKTCNRDRCRAKVAVERDLVDEVIIQSLACRPATNADLCDAHPDLSPQTLLNPLRRLVRTGRITEHAVPCKPATAIVPVYTLADAAPPGGVVVDRRWFPDGEAPPSRSEQANERRAVLHAEQDRLVIDAIKGGAETIAEIAKSARLTPAAASAAAGRMFTAGRVTRYRGAEDGKPFHFHLAGVPAAGDPVAGASGSAPGDLTSPPVPY